MDRAVIAALLALSLGCSSYYLRRADSAAEAGDYETARELYHHVATDGMNGYARLQLAKIYDEGLVGEPNSAEALRWYRASADLGNGYAQFKAGQLLEEGRGSAPDEQAAAKYYGMASNQGETLATLRLAEMALDGRGMAQDVHLAQTLLETAARQGNTQASYRLGILMLQPGAPQAQLKAGFDWLLVAAHQGHALAQTSLAEALRDGAGVAVDEKLAKVWFREAADRGNIAAQHELSNLDEADGDIEQANQWRLAAAESGYIPAQIAIAEQCQDTGADPACAAHWYTEAANDGNAYAQYQMGLLAESGEGVPRDLTQARKWYAMAAEGEMLAARQRLRALGGG